MKRHIKSNVYWVGKVDWELKLFHGHEYSTHRGSTYNSYLVMEEKTALIDTVWSPFGKEFVDNLAKEIDLTKIDLIVANHAETDHSGGLPELMKRIPDTPIYCTTNCIKALKGHYHQDWNFHPVKTGDRVSLGSKDLIFIEAPMLHWPDSMFCYLTNDNILFSNDAFGQHYASELLFNDLVDPCELWAEAIKYYANILTPFSKLVTKKINEFVSMGVPLDMICTSQGVIWRDNPLQIVEQYLKWADNYQENQVTVIYDSMWGATRVMAESIAQGIKRADRDLTIKIHNAAKSDKNDVLTDVFKSKGILIGSSTLNRGTLFSTTGLLEEIRGLEFKGKKGAAFGSYGWSGESVNMISEGLKKAGIDVVDDGVKVQWHPDDTAVERCMDYGKQFAAKL
ncbi:MAG TPA: anaerobic nitric oxide reductase flavorubredoxin [Bacillota bacterium]|nr:anaerobic nitric oxide reductase flavorubredoxin [Bacillota bacterium]